MSVGRAHLSHTFSRELVFEANSIRKRYPHLVFCIVGLKGGLRPVLTQNLDRVVCCQKRQVQLDFSPQIEAQGEVRQKQEAAKNATPSCFFENGQTTNQEMHNRKVNQNHKTKHDLLIVQFWEIDVCSKMQMEVSIIWKNHSLVFLGVNPCYRTMFLEF